MRRRWALACAVLAIACTRERTVPTVPTAPAPLAIPPLGAIDATDAGDGDGPSVRVTTRPAHERRAGDAVEVEWHGEWYAATILARTGEGWLVHYDGYDESWDEVVGDERMRAPSP